LKHFTTKLGSDLLNNFLQSSLHPFKQYLTPILRTKYHMVLAPVDHVMIALEFSVFTHAKIVYGSKLSSASATPYIPIPEARGFTTLFR
jgi:hypothetical protein